MSFMTQMNTVLSNFGCMGSCIQNCPSGNEGKERNKSNCIFNLK